MSPTENSNIRKPQVNIDTTIQSATPKQTSSEDEEYYYYYYYEEKESDQDDEAESHGNQQFKWIPGTWGEVGTRFSKLLV